MCEDNKAAIIVAEVEMSSAGRSKHIDVRLKHVAQSIREGVARVRYVSTKWNYADLMTKPLAKLKVKRLRDLCLGSRIWSDRASVYGASSPWMMR